MCYTSGISEVKFGTRNFRVLTVTSGKRRLNNLMKMTKDAGGNRRFWFTTFDQIDAESILSSPIWNVIDKDTLQCLAE
jgi:hypothetical protein